MYNFFNYFYFMFLSFSPIFIIIFLFFVNSNNIVILRKIGILYSFLLFFLFSLLYFSFNTKIIGFQYIYRLVWSKNLNFDLIYGIDGISFCLLFLTTLLIPICILCSWDTLKIRFKYFLICLFFAEFLLIQTFAILDLFWFYIFFEASLIPMFCIIGIWGSRNRRISASYQFFLYTFTGSIFFLASIIFILFNYGSTNYFYLFHTTISQSVQLFLWVAFFVSFAVKVPMFPVHIWLPEAHVEAPTAGSVLLAGILLKLGTYGFLRYSVCLLPYASQYFSPFIFTLSAVGLIYSSCTTLRQVDLKKIIAYTSVAHMNLVTMGIFCQNAYGIEGSLFLMFSHGFVSSGLFLCVGYIYDRYGTRLLRFYGGLVNFMPIFSFCFIVLNLANMALPGTSSFIGEFLILLGIFNNNSFICIFSSLSVILSAAYSLWLVNRFLFGKVSTNITYYADLNIREFIVIAFIVFLVFFFGIFPNVFLNLVHNDVANIVLSYDNWYFSEAITKNDFQLDEETKQRLSYPAVFLNVDKFFKNLYVKLK